MGANIGSVNNELCKGIGFELDAVSELLLCLFNAVLFKLFVEVVKVFLRINGLDPFLPLPFEPDTIF